MTPECKIALLSIAYMGMLLSRAMGYKRDAEETATIKQTGEVFTFTQLKAMFP